MSETVIVEEKPWTEPEIIINGIKLTMPQAMTLRVALGSFSISLNHDGLGNDDHGKFMTKAYAMRANEIHKIMQVT